MAVDTFHCPGCQAMLRYSTDLQPGTEVRCPQCQQTFAVPEQIAAPDAASAAPAAANAGREITTEPTSGQWPSSITDDPSAPRGQRRYPDDDEDYPRPSYGQKRDPDAPLSNRYAVDVNRWFSIATAHYSTILGPAVGYMLFIFVIQIAVAILGLFVVLSTGIRFSNLPISLLNAIFVTPALVGGMLLVFMKQLNGRPWTFGEFFNGFQGRYYGKLVACYLLVTLIATPLYAPLVAAIVAFVLDASAAVTIPLFVLGIVGMLAAMYFLTRLFFFALPLIMDRELGPVEAMKGSWTITQSHFWIWFGVYLLVSLIAASGVFACYVGALFTVPLALLVQMAAYLDVAGLRPPRPTPAEASATRESEPPYPDERPSFRPDDPSSFRT